MGRNTLKTHSTQRVQEAQMRELLRKVDAELINFGPRRAMTLLGSFESDIPHRLKKHWRSQRDELAAMVERRRMEEADAELLNSPQCSARDVLNSRREAYQGDRSAKRAVIHTRS